VILLRRVLGDALRARRQAQHRTLREVSGAANVSLGYLSEIERGQKEASSELLSAICDALGAQLSELMRDVSDTLELVELTESGLLDRERRLEPAGVGAGSGAAEPAESAPVEFTAPPPREPEAYGGTVTNFVGEGPVAVAVHRNGPFKTTLRATRQHFDIVGV
jgi:XRE family transcriptional regulator, stress-response regulator